MYVNRIWSFQMSWSRCQRSGALTLSIFAKCWNICMDFRHVYTSEHFGKNLATKYIQNWSTHKHYFKYLHNPSVSSSCVEFNVFDVFCEPPLDVSELVFDFIDHISWHLKEFGLKDQVWPNLKLSQNQMLTIEMTWKLCHVHESNKVLLKKMKMFFAKPLELLSFVNTDFNKFGSSYQWLSTTDCFEHNLFEFTWSVRSTSQYWNIWQDLQHSS